MSRAHFGAPAGLLHRLTRSEVRVSDVRAAVDRLAAGSPGSPVQLDVVDGDRGPMLVLDDAGRCTRMLIGELAAAMSRSGVPSTPEGVGAALTAWLARRPVPDRTASLAGVAVLDWADAGQTVLGWRVAVVRDGSVVTWCPSRTATPQAVHRTRAQAMDRAGTVEGTLRLQGPVGLWTSAVPGLDSAALVRPETLLARMTGRGVRLHDARLVVTPHRPVACADAPVARRLAAEATDPCVTLPWQAALDLGWA